VSEALNISYGEAIDLDWMDWEIFVGIDLIWYELHLFILRHAMRESQEEMATGRAGPIDKRARGMGSFQGKRTVVQEDQAMGPDRFL